MKTVIIGANAAGMSFAAKYKRNNPESEVIAFEKRDYVSFGSCGLPYYVGEFFEDKGEMIARSVEATIKSGIDLRINCEVVKVDTDKKEVTVLVDGNEQIETYEQLIISTGARPIVPNFGEYNKDNVTTLVDMADGDRLKALMADEANKNITIIGGGFIGLEVMDAAHHLGKNVTLIEREGHIMSRQFSPELIEKVETSITEAGINLMLGTSVNAINDADKGYTITTDQGEVSADVIVMALGFAPKTQMFDLEKLGNGAILTDRYSQTSVENVYAIGDCATIYNQVEDRMVYLPLATSANKQGRMVADYLSGNDVFFKGMLASSCLKVLDFELACTGMNEQTAISLGIDHKVKVITDKNHTSYFPGQSDIQVKLVYRKENNELLGAEMIGHDGVVGRIDAVAVAIQAKMTTQELGYVDFCYAPPFARTWDILNVAGNVSK